LADHVSVRYNPEKTRIRLCGAITDDLIFALIDEIDLAINYYGYQVVEIEVNSFGGNLLSLKHYLSHLNNWRKEKGVRFETVATTTVASAAAMIVSLGDVPYRRAWSHSWLLWHKSRIPVVSDATLTDEHLEAMYRQLRDTDALLIRQVAEHVYHHKVCSEKTSSGDYRWRTIPTLHPNLSDGNPGLSLSAPESFAEVNCGSAEHLSLEQIEEVYRALWRVDHPIAPEFAQKMLLIDEIM
jgi:ATP-dependent protease ClpP protease subunit